MRKWSRVMTSEEKVEDLIKKNFQPVEDKPGYVWFSKRNFQIISIETLRKILCETSQVIEFRTESEVREEITTTCIECPYSDIYDWDQDPKTGKALPIYWCEKLKEMCDDKTKCKMQICKK